MIAAAHLGVEGKLLNSRAGDVPAVTAELAALLKSGKLKSTHTVVPNGFDRAADELRRVILGETHGGVVIEVL